ncbi:hypothetical protein ABEB36_005261 [Hypothenemus hampei]|uniref:ABC transporter domain-containing protein n=1 Tax=Hypothenemus hampei TaxID=57062 RepID=A0ABD1F0M2_HYPHA
MDEVRSSPSARLKNTAQKRPDSLHIDLLLAPENGLFHLNDLSENECDNSVNVSFQNISYYVNEGFFKRRKKMLLNGINGEFYSSELSAIVGPSGAGKSTLMDILAGYTTDNLTGEIYVNDNIRDLSLFRKQACYIMQDDHLQPLLTVYEAMTIASDLKLSNTLSRQEKNEQVKAILVSVDLWTQRKVKTQELSGGQKKRLSIALELLTNPQIMFFDEPTSGLDSVSSMQCIQILKKLASSNRTIICTIHQPSATILDLFDHLYVVADGSCMYQGSVKALLPYLEDIHLVCPTFHNPSDFLLEVLNGDHGSYNEVLLKKSQNGLNQNWRKQIKAIPIVQEPRTPSSISKSIKEVKSYMKRQTRFCSNSYSISIPSQVAILVKRTILIISRDKTLTLNRLLTHFLIALFIGTLYFGIGTDAGDMLNNIKFMFFSIMFLMLTSFNCITTTFPSELPIITREHFNKWYSLKSYYLALTFADIPVQIFATLLYGSITYLFTKQPIESFRLILFLCMCVLISLVAQSFGLFIGACMDVKNGVIFGPFCMLPFTIFSGFFVQMNACHPSMQWLFHISFLKYGFEGMVLSVLGYNRPNLPCNKEYCHFVRPDKFLSTMDMQESTYSAAVKFLLGLFFFIRICTYFVLKFQIRKSRGRRK